MYENSAHVLTWANLYSSAYKSESELLAQLMNIYKFKNLNFYIIFNNILLINQWFLLINHKSELNLVILSHKFYMCEMIKITHLFVWEFACIRESKFSVTRSIFNSHAVQFSCYIEFLLLLNLKLLKLSQVKLSL